jgi:hypothetical protein
MVNKLSAFCNKKVENFLFYLKGGTQTQKNSYNDNKGLTSSSLSFICSFLVLLLCLQVNISSLLFHFHDNFWTCMLNASGSKTFSSFQWYYTDRETQRTIIRYERDTNTSKIKTKKCIAWDIYIYTFKTTKAWKKVCFLFCVFFFLKKDHNNLHRYTYEHLQKFLLSKWWPFSMILTVYGKKYSFNVHFCFLAHILSFSEILATSFHFIL